MKKILTALTIGALVAGTAFADFSVNLNFRQRAALYYGFGGEGVTNTKTAGWLDAYDDNGSDNFTMKMKGDILTFDFMLVTNEAATDNWRFKNVDGELKLGNFTLFAGTVSDGKSNGAFRVKNDCDAGAFEGPDMEYKKLGSIYAKSPSLFVDNPLQTVGGAGENYAVSAKYKLAFDAGSLDLSGWYISNESSATTNAAGSATQLSGHTGVFLADGNFDFGRAEAVFKYGEYTAGIPAMAFGAYVQPKIMDGLTLTVGGNGSTVDGKFTDWGVDLRARYAAGALSVSSFHALSGLTDDGVEKFANASSTKGIANASNVAKMLSGTAVSSSTIMSNNVLVRYKVSDKFAVTGILADMIELGDEVASNAKADEDTQIQFRGSAWAQFYAAAKAYVNMGLVCSINNVTEANNGKKYYTWAVPVIFRVQM